MAARPAAMEVRVVRAAAYAAGATLVAIAAAFLVRRATGEFQQPLASWALLLTAIVAGGIAAAVRYTLWRYGLITIRPAIVAYSGVGPAAMILLAAVTLPGTAPWVVFVAWFGLTMAEAGSWVAFTRHALRRKRASVPVLAPERNAQRARLAVLAEDDEANVPDMELPAGLVQQLTRIREDETESLHLLLRVDVPVGERIAAAHVAFCPPLVAPPELEAHLLSDDDAEVRVTTAETFGARFEIRLPHAGATARQVLLEVLGTAAARAAPAIQRQTGSG